MSFRAHLWGASALLALAIWLSSGTMTPVASTFFRPIVSTPCGYLYNVDHPQYEATFQMLDGQPPERWRSSLVLRRVLFPIVAYPLMKVAGFEVGGFIASVLCQIAGLVALGLFLRRRYGDEAAQTGIWLLAVYPGITYWAALPYSNLTVVPASIGLFILLTRLDDVARDTPGRAFGPIAGVCAGMGVLFTAYDLLPFFGLAAVIVLVRRRRFVELPVALPALLAGPLLASALLWLLLHVPWANRNTSHYGIVARAYLHPPPLGVWLRSLADFPLVVLVNYFYGNLVFLPALFLAALVLARLRLALAEAALLLAVALGFLFNNLAPPYEDRWQMRGDFIPRLYQPVFVALLVYSARALGAWRTLPPRRSHLLFAAALLAFVGNLSIAFGPIARVPGAGYIYGRFYQHSTPDTMDAMLSIHGRRPLGFCGRR